MALTDSKMVTTTVFERNLDAWHGGKRRALNEGGTASSKTFSCLQALILIARHAKKSLLISVVSESLPHLRRGAIRDFFRILEEPQDNNPHYNKTDNVYTFGNGRIEFFGADQADKVRGPRRDILFLNEANNIPWETARGLDIRTSRFTFADWNPVSQFWAHEHWLGEPENAYIHSTYLDAEAVVSQKVIDNIIATGAKDANWANVYVYGKLGKIEGLVYPDFGLIDVLPDGDIFYGLDFGFSADPASLIKSVIQGDNLYSQELIYEAGMTNQAIAERMAELGVQKHHDEIFADSAEPKSIEEIHRYGFNIKGSLKGPDSVEYGHQRLRQYNQYWTRDSVNCIKEQRNFRYITDRDGKITSKTTHYFSHGMDARRYSVVMKIGAITDMIETPREPAHTGRLTVFSEVY